MTIYMYVLCWIQWLQLNDIEQNRKKNENEYGNGKKAAAATAATTKLLS